MKKHTKLVTLFLAGAMALSLAACSGGGGEEFNRESGSRFGRMV